MKYVYIHFPFHPHLIQAGCQKTLLQYVNIRVSMHWRITVLIKLFSRHPCTQFTQDTENAHKRKAIEGGEAWCRALAMGSHRDPITLPNGEEWPARVVEPGTPEALACGDRGGPILTGFLGECFYLSSPSPLPPSALGPRLLRTVFGARRKMGTADHATKWARAHRKHTMGPSSPQNGHGHTVNTPWAREQKNEGEG